MTSLSVALDGEDFYRHIDVAGRMRLANARLVAGNA